MAVIDPALPEKAVRVKAFVSFFKSYMSVGALVTASLPIPLTAWGAIPTFTSQTKILSTYTPLFCFLLLGFIFYSRHRLARVMFVPGIMTWRAFLVRGLVASLPFLLIVCALVAVFGYHASLDRAMQEVRARMILEAVVSGRAAWVPSGMRERPEQAVDDAREGLRALSAVSSVRDLAITRTLAHFTEFVPSPSSRDVLQAEEIPGGATLMMLHMALFLFAEAAFILMAVREYLQDVLRLDDVELIQPAGPAKVGMSSR